MRAIHTVASLRGDHGGPGRSVTALCSELATQGLDIDLITLRGGAGEGAAILPSSAKVHTESVCDDNSPLSLFRQERFRSRLAGSMHESGRTVLHDHGLWLPTNHSSAVIAHRLRVRRVVSPRGMLSRWALDYRRWKKRLGWVAYQRRDLQTASLIHVTSEQEAEEVRRLGVHCPVAIIPNGVDLPAPTDRSVRSNAVRRALFLSRLHPKKGILGLLEAWSRVAPKCWRLDIAGPDEGGHRVTLEARISELGLTQCVRFLGSLDDRAKWTAYEEADLFVLPTFSENFGIVVAEALASGLPVITTKGAPWSGVVTNECGWWTEIGVDPLAEALRAAFAMSDEARRAMGARGREFVKRDFSWRHVADRMVVAYEWLLTGGQPPADILAD